MNLTTLLIAVIGLVLGFAAGVTITRSSAKGDLAVVRAERDAALARCNEINAAREVMSNQFKVLSAEILERQLAATEAHSAERLRRTEVILAPLEESLTEMNKRLVEAERERSKFTSQLSEQVGAVSRAEETLRREASSLSTALRKPQVRGAWGELSLKRVVEAAGMVNHVHFYEQETTLTSADHVIRPDLKVMLGDGTFIYVDSKVPLISFLEANETNDENVRAERLAAFGRTVRAHVDALSAKKYWKAQSGTPEFVVLFIPSESLSAEALSQQPDLIEYAQQKGIILASPTTLIALLRTISYGWKQTILAENAAEVFELGRELYSRLSSLGEHIDKLGRSLLGSVTAYNAAVGSLEGRVLVTARRFKNLELTDAELNSPPIVEQTPRTLSADELTQTEQN